MELLRKEFIELLEKDRDFRYTVAGYIGLADIMKRLDNIAEEQAGLRREQIRIVEEQVKLRVDFNVRMGRVERTLEKLTLDIEEEARLVVTDRVKKELNMDVELSSLILPDLELNLYCATDDLCVVGEASVRASGRLVDELLGKVEALRKSYPNVLRRRVVPVIYCSTAMPGLAEAAAEKGVWVLKAIMDVVKPRLL